MATGRGASRPLVEDNDFVARHFDHLLPWHAVATARGGQPLNEAAGAAVAYGLGRTPEYGEISSRTRPLVSMAKRPTVSDAAKATNPKVRNTVFSPPSATRTPTTFGPMIEASRSHAVAVPTASARLRVDKVPAYTDKPRATWCR